jgi:hypothetical protein
MRLEEWSGWEELNTPSADWKSATLALSYTRGKQHYCTFDAGSATEKDRNC